MSERQTTVTRNRSQAPAQASPPTDRTQQTITNQGWAARRAEGVRSEPPAPNQADGVSDQLDFSSNAGHELQSFRASFSHFGEAPAPSGNAQHEKKWNSAYDALKNLKENSDLSSYSQEQRDKLDEFASDPDYGDDIASYTGKERLK